MLTLSHRLTRLLRLISLAHQATKLLFSLAQEGSLLASGNQAWVFSCPALHRQTGVKRHPKITIQVCLKSLLFSETINKRLLPWMARVEMDCKLKNWVHFFILPSYMYLEKSA